MNAKRCKVLRKAAQELTRGMPDVDYVRQKGTIRLNTQSTKGCYRLLKKKDKELA